MELKVKFGKSAGFIELLRFLKNAPILLQGMNSKVYRYSEGLITSVMLFRPGVFCLLAHTSSIKILDRQILQWNYLPVTIEGDTRTDKEKRDYFDK